MSSSTSRMLRYMGMTLAVLILLVTAPSTAIALSPVATTLSTAALQCPDGWEEVVAPPSSTDPSYCRIIVGTSPTPGDDGSEESGGGGDGPAEPRVCTVRGYVLPCVSAGLGYFNDAYNCWLKPTPEVDTSPRPSETAVWYLCTEWCVLSAGVGTCIDSTLWLEPWIANDTANPAIAAGEVIGRLAVQGIDIGFAPDPDAAGSRGYVGMPVWMWVDSVTNQNYGPYTVVEEEQGVVVTANAQVTSIRWVMGDGQSVSCSGIGMEYQASLGIIDSPSCGYRYQTTSDDEPNGRFTVTAVSNWRVDWNAGGATGSQTIERESTTQVDVRELQSVNTGGAPG